VTAEWAESLHARAWTNANVRAATDDFRKAGCRACHSPLPVLAESLDQAPDYRDFNQADGVSCLACHGLEDGVAAARTLSTAPCRPRAEPRLASVDLCYPCHQPTHQAFDEYRRSRAAAQGKRCTDCHMPLRADGSGRSHGAHGGFDRDFVRTALDWQCALEAREVVLRLTNRTGHRFPGEISSRSLLVRVRFPGHEDVTELLRRPHKGEERADNRLDVDETRELRFALPAGADSAEVELTFLQLPLMPVEQGFRLGRWSSAEPTPVR